MGTNTAPLYCAQALMIYAELLFILIFGLAMLAIIRAHSSITRRGAKILNIPKSKYGMQLTSYSYKA
jgi:hypothetical protein